MMNSYLCQSELDSLRLGRDFGSVKLYSDNISSSRSIGLFSHLQILFSIFYSALFQIPNLCIFKRKTLPMPVVFLKAVLGTIFLFIIVSQNYILKQWQPSQEQQLLSGNSHVDRLELKKVYRLDPDTNNILYLDMPQHNEQYVMASTNYTVKSVPGITFKPKKINRHAKLLRLFNEPVDLEPSFYMMPNIKDHNTILTLSMMSFDAYIEVGSNGQWYDLDSEWGIVSLFFSLFNIL